MKNSKKINLIYITILLSSILLLVKCQTKSSNSGAYIEANTQLEAGRYLVIIGGCNDCHTEEYAMKEGNVPEDEWLTGSVIGNQGPWGTTYASNLRLFVQDINEDDWVETIQTRKSMPPMPWMNVNNMSDVDARAIYKYLKSLGPKGEKMPRNVPPGKVPKTPYISYVPLNMDVEH